MRDGKSIVVDVPAPAVRKNSALVQTAASLVSAGTERMVVEFAEKSLLGKARSRPDLVRQVLDKAHREGLLTALKSAFNRLDQPMALGYSSAGVILEIGEGLLGFKVGDRVACAGGGFAVHAEYAVVPQNLLIPIPDNVDFESAAFTTLGAIALQGFRLAQPQLGERIAVIGLGLLGLLTVGIARAAGCSVFGVDLDPRRVELARKMGATAVLRSDAESAGSTFSRGRGFDAVLICADAHSDDPINLAGVLARDHGQVIAVGAVGLNIARKMYYDKELHFQVSRSYGPGRYDADYEERGRDYPYGYVRWTEGRNLQAFVELLGQGKIDVHPIISHRFPIEAGEQAYELITGKTGDPFLGVLLTYPQTGLKSAAKVNVAPRAEHAPEKAALKLGVLGAGNYASAVFLPILHSVPGVIPIGIVSAAGLNARHAAQKFGYTFASSDEKDVLENPEINLVTILTRHSVHTRQTLEALRHGKHVYCEKPLAINAEQLAELEAALNNEDLPLLMAGFNRRFAPFAVELARFFANRSEPFNAHYRINAGYIPLNHWTQDPAVGGGRMIGEGCHFVDFLTFLAGAAPVRVSAHALPDGGRYAQDNGEFTFTFPDGSLGTVTYLANGDKSFAKERVEVFCQGRVAVLNDFRSLELVENGRRKILRSAFSQDKGHRAAWQIFVDAVRNGGAAPIPYDQLMGVTRATFAAVHSLEQGRELDI